MPKTDVFFRHWHFVPFCSVKTPNWFEICACRTGSADDNVKVQMAVLSWPHKFIPLLVSDSCQCSVPLIMEKH